MMEQLKLAFENMKQGKIEETAKVVAALKALPRTAEGIFDFGSICDDVYEVARLAYPVYCAYETEKNGKEGYPDIVEQIRAWDKVTKTDKGVEQYGAFLDMLMSTIEQMSPQIYEYYRECEDIFRVDVKDAIACYYQNGAFDLNEDIDSMVKETIRRACDAEVLLAEKYQEYVV